VNVFAITQKVVGPCGHGEPGTEYLALADERTAYSFKLRKDKMRPVFSSLAAAEKYLSTMEYKNWYGITMLRLIEE